MGKGGGGGGGTSTTVQKADPWSGQQPYLQGGDGILGVFPEAHKLYANGQLAPGYYPGQTVADMDKYTKQAIEMQANAALQGSPLLDSAGGALQNILNGNAMAQNPGMGLLGSDGVGMSALKDMMAGDANPHLDNMYGQAAGAVQSGLNANFSKAGRYGSGAHVAASGDALGNLATQMYGSAYESDANRRLQASSQYNQAAGQLGQLYNQATNQQLMGMGTAQDLANQRYTDAAALGEAGGMLQNHEQQKINADINRYNHAANQPANALQQYMSLIQGNYGGTSTTTQQTSGNGTSKLGGVLSGASAGAAAGSVIGPWGTLLGGLGGGLLSLF